VSEREREKEKLGLSIFTERVKLKIDLHPFVRVPKRASSPKNEVSKIKIK
jgi:hypothetical protein